jgi:hypothetical protein
MLAAHMYGMNVRLLMKLTAGERREVDAILELARNAPPSQARARFSSDSGPVNRSDNCQKKRHPAKFGHVVRELGRPPFRP